MGFTVFCPAHGWMTFRDVDSRFVSESNRQVLKRSDVILANLSHGTGFETIREIEMARQLAIPVVVVIPPKFRSAGLWDLYVVQSLGEAREVLQEVHDRLYKERYPHAILEPAQDPENGDEIDPTRGVEDNGV
jgi:hypothetical protein